MKGEVTDGILVSCLAIVAYVVKITYGIAVDNLGNQIINVGGKEIFDGYEIQILI